MPIVVAIFIIIGAFLAGNSIVSHQVKPAVTEDIKIETLSPSPTSTPTPTPAPQVKVNQVAPTPYDPIVDCIGPDGKHSQKTQKECDNFNAAWRKPQQANRNNVPNNQSGTVNCQTQSGWVHMTQDDCTKAQNAWGNQILDNTKQQEQANQKIIDMFHSYENEMWQATNLDQLDNLRERLRQIQGPDPSIQNYIATLIRLIEARIKILQQQ